MGLLSNPRHERFAQELAAGKSATAAYIAAGYDAKGNAAEAAASRLLRDVKVQARLAELQSRIVDDIKLSREWVLERLMENVERSMQRREVIGADGEPSGEYRYEGNVANRALELLGKELKMFVDRKEVGAPGEFDNMSADELRDHIAREAAELGLGHGAASPAGGKGTAGGKPH